MVKILQIKAATDHDLHIKESISMLLRRNNILELLSKCSKELNFSITSLKKFERSIL